MRAGTAALKALIAAGNTEWVKADLYTFYTASGSVLARYTNVNMNLSVNPDGSAGGPTYDGTTGLLLKRGNVKTVVGVEVDTLEITLMADATLTINAVPWLQAIRNGVLDGGRVRLDRFLSDSWTNTAVGSVYWFGGRVGSIQSLGRSSAKINVLSDLTLLNIKMPRELYQPSCNNTLYDVKCGLNRATYRTSGTVAAGSTVGKINASLPSSSWDLGYIQFTSGVNAGVIRGVKSSVGGGSGSITLSVPLFSACANGDTFYLFKGCDKTQYTCNTVFGNMVNFRGMPYIPRPETAL